MVRKACRAGLAGFRALLDENSKQILTEKETPRRYLHWTNGQPTKQYRKAAQNLSRLLKQRTRQRIAYRHQVSAQIVKHCVQNGLQFIALEDLNIKGMTKSASGTVEQPNHRRAQKQGLNRRILEQGWGQLISFIKYKARAKGIRVVEVYPGSTSITCSTCGLKDKNSRKKKKFHCTNCHHQADADLNAALNIGDRGTYIYLKCKGATMESIRQHRFNQANGLTPEQQEPGTGTDDAPIRRTPRAKPASTPAPQPNSSLLTTIQL